jgi:hypothetical protein
VKLSNLIRAAVLGAVVVCPAVYLFADDKAADDKADAGASVAAAKDEQGFKSLFDGKSLDGWEGREGFWSVQDGAITGQTKQTFGGPNTFLVWKGGDVSDFELRAKYKIVGGNSGIQYRSKVIDPKLFRVGGYQGDFEAGKTYSGINYEELGRGILAERGTRVTLTANGEKKVEKLPMSSEQLQKAIKQEDWNDYVIVAKGNHLTHKINGNTTSEVIDESGKGAKSGVLALQLHAGPPMMVQFKEIRIKQLDGGAK